MWILELIGGGSDKPQWSVLRHNGPMFPSEYVPHLFIVIVFVLLTYMVGLIFHSHKL